MVYNLRKFFDAFRQVFQKVKDSSRGHVTSTPNNNFEIQIF